MSYPSESDCLLALALLPDFGPVRFQALIDHFDSASLALRASPSELRSVRGLGQETIARLLAIEDLVDVPEEKRRMADHEVTLILRTDESYPGSLLQTHAPPILLFAKGDVTPRDARAIGIVGSRRTTHYGREQAKRFSFQLAAAGVTVISGLARGIDTVAHEAALAAGGRTIAVMGSGHGKLYPPENAALAGEVCKNGAVLSEFPILYNPDKRSFPLRNRIVAGMSKGLLVVEAPVRSGSMITAQQALEAGRDVFAVPGPVDRPSSGGCHRLIRDGATLVTSPQELLEDLETIRDMQMDLPLFESEPAETLENEPVQNAETAPQLSPLEDRIMAALADRDQTPDELSDAISEPISSISTSLLKLEMKGCAKQLSGKIFTKLI